MIFEILTYPILLAGQLINTDLEITKYLALLNIFFGIVCMIYKARICIDLCGDLKVNKNWAWLWVFAEVIPCLVWAYNDKYTPSKALLRYNGLDPILDEADPIPDSYVFEVGSAGADRELKRPGDFEQFMGSEVEVSWTAWMSMRNTIR